MPKILVVDDEEDQEELIIQGFANKDYLREYEFIFARDGLKALQLIKDNADIDLALLDINMRNGWSHALQNKGDQPCDAIGHFRLWRYVKYQGSHEQRRS
jgi:CheY-like chemotaxis protein